MDAERGMSMTLAADLLGMPSLPGEFNAKVFAQHYCGVCTSFAHLL